MGVREAKKEQVRQRLLEVAQEKFALQGYENTTVADIVVDAGIGRGTFYNYFVDLKGIFDEIIDHHYQIMRIKVKEARAKQKTIYDFLYASFITYLDYVSQPPLQAFYVNNQAYIRSISFGSETIQHILREITEDLQAAGLISEKTKAQEYQLLSYVLVGTVSEMFFNLYHSDINISNEDLAQYLSDLFVNGLGSHR